MQTTQITTNIGGEDTTVGVCAFLSPANREQVTRLLTQLSQELDGSIWCMPPESLHITLCEIFQSKQYAEDKELLFQRYRDQYQTALQEVLGDVQPIAVTFTAIEVSPHAIIIRGTDDGTFDTLRAKLIDALPLPAETKRPPNIIHSSIARFTKEVDLDTVTSVVAEQNISFTETITEFQLLHRIWLQMQSYEIAARYPLGKK